jgi:hypothetical protein
VKPLIDLSLFKATLTEKLQLAEKVQVQAKFFSRDHITYVVPQELLDQARAAQGKALPPADLSTEPIPDPPVKDPARPSLVLPIRVGVVKAWDFTGTRLQIEFAILNDSDRLIALRNIMVLIDGSEIPDPHASGYAPDAVHFKQFVDVTPDVRLPSRRRRLPVVVPARTGLWLCAELESPEDVRFGASERECALFAALDDHTNLRARFAAHGDAFWGTLLAQTQEAVTGEKSAAVLGVPITPIA